MQTSSSGCADRKENDPYEVSITCPLDFLGKHHRGSHGFGDFPILGSNEGRGSVVSRPRRMATGTGATGHPDSAWQTHSGRQMFGSIVPRAVGFDRGGLD